jgi:hypothetical protein
MKVSNTLAYPDKILLTAITTKLCCLNGRSKPKATIKLLWKCSIVSNTLAYPQLMVPKSIVTSEVKNRLLFVSDKTIKLWKVSERDKRAEGYNLKEDNGLLRDPNAINTLRVRIRFDGL